MTNGGGEAKPTTAVVATIVWGVLLFPGLMGAALSVMFFDAPGSINNPAAWTNALIVVSFPVLCAISIGASWIVWMWRKQSATRAAAGAQLVAAALPLLPVGYFVVVLVVGTIGILFSGQPLGLHSTIIKH